MKRISEKKLIKCDALRGLLEFVQFKKREKHPWRSVLNYTNATKLRSAPQMISTAKLYMLVAISS